MTELSEPWLSPRRAMSLLLLLLLAVAWAAWAGSGPPRQPPPASVTGAPAAAAGYGDLPLAFQASAGRYRDVDFLSDSAAGTVAVGRRGIELAQAYGSDRHPRTAVARLALPGATLADPAGIHRLPGVVNDLRGDPSQHVTGIPTFGRVGYQGVWPGVDLALHGRTGAPEYDFRLAPGADPGRISLRVTGADRLSISRSGDLLIEDGGAVFRQRAPVAYQPGAAGRTPVAAAFVLGGNRVSFDLGAYDRDRPLVIDPVTVAYSTYLGGSGEDSVSHIAVDSSGAAYVVGITHSPNFDTVGPQVSSPSGFDAFVSKLNPAGSALDYSTYLGGSDSDFGYDIAVDQSGAVYASGSTVSADFPTTPGAFQTVYGGGGSDPFVLKLNPAGSALVYSTFLGGSASDATGTLALDSNGAVTIGGTTSSVNFPVTAGAAQTAAGGGIDGYIATLNPTGTALVSSTFVGGADFDSVNALARGADGSIYATGETLSTDFPRVGGFEGRTGDIDTFVLELNPAGTAFSYSTYLGGTARDEPTSIAVDGDGSAYVSGVTESSDFDTVGEVQGDGAGPDGFVSKVDPTGSALAYSTYLGGDGLDVMLDIAVDSDGVAWVAGHSASSDFPAVEPVEGDSGDLDAVLLALEPTGSALRFSTLFGGTGIDSFSGIALAGDAAYLAGFSTSADFDRVGGVEGPSGGSDAVITKFSLDRTGPQTSITTSPPDGGSITDRTPSFGFAADEQRSSFECSLVPAGSAPSFGPCTGPGDTHTPAADLAYGDWTFAVRATDPFANTDPTPATVDFTVTRELASCLGRTATVQATDGDDVIVGTPGDDVIIGRAGDDTLRGLGGADLLCGKQGDDRLRGGAGEDRIQAGAELKGDSGTDHDVAFGGGDADVIYGYSGDEKLVGGAGSDEIHGGEGADKVRGKGGSDDLRGGAGPDRLDGGGRRDRCIGGPDRDRLRNCETRS